MALSEENTINYKKNDWDTEKRTWLNNEIAPAKKNVFLKKRIDYSITKTNSYVTCIPQIEKLIHDDIILKQKNIQLFPKSYFSTTKLCNPTKTSNSSLS